VQGATIPPQAQLFPGSVAAESLADRLIQFPIEGGRSDSDGGLFWDLAFGLGWRRVTSALLKSGEQVL
jgi:hypothetical protein